jgi:hypothetical protein
MEEAVDRCCCRCCRHALYQNRLWARSSGGWCVRVVVMSVCLVFSAHSCIPLLVGSYVAGMCVQRCVIVAVCQYSARGVDIQLFVAAYFWFSCNLCSSLSLIPGQGL